MRTFTRNTLLPCVSFFIVLPALAQNDDRETAQDEGAVYDASSEPNRNIRWEIYPSEIVSSLQVYKSQSADLISGGVAGTIDLRTISPLDYVGETFVVRAGPT